MQITDKTQRRQHEGLPRREHIGEDGARSAKILRSAVDDLPPSIAARNLATSLGRCGVEERDERTVPAASL
jgi:hypothetical protein